MNVLRQINDYLGIVTNGKFYSSKDTMNYLNKKTLELEDCLLKFLLSSTCVRQNNYENEIQLTKKINLNDHVTLYDVLICDPCHCYRLIKNCDYKALLYSSDFFVVFPNIGGIIRGHFAKSLIRRFATIASRDYLRSLTIFSTPDLCCDKIFDYLDNESLYNLCLAVHDQ